ARSSLPSTLSPGRRAGAGLRQSRGSWKSVRLSAWCSAYLSRCAVKTPSRRARRARSLPCLPRDWGGGSQSSSTMSASPRASPLVWSTPAAARTHVRPRSYWRAGSPDHSRVPDLARERRSESSGERTEEERERAREERERRRLAKAGTARPAPVAPPIPPPLAEPSATDDGPPAAPLVGDPATFESAHPVLP